MTAVRWAVVGMLAIAPWLRLLPVGSPLVAVLLASVTLTAACHGAGQLVSLATRGRLGDPALAIGWGIATLLVVGGVLVALHAFAALPLLGAAAGFHSILVVRERERIREWGARVELRGALPWIALLALAALLQIAGTAGSTLRPFDDDGNVLGQIARLVQTGTLGDPVGAPRWFQLGGAEVLGALGDDPLLALAVDRGLAFVLTLVLVRTRLARTQTHGGLLAALVVVGALAMSYVAPDAAPCWSGVLLLVTAYVTLEMLGLDALGAANGGTAERPTAALIVAIVAAALVSLRLELAPPAVTVVIGAWFAVRADRGTKRLAVLLGVMLAALAPYVIARQLAWSSVGHDVASLVAPKLPGLGVRALLFVVVLVPAAYVMTIVLPRRWPALATAAGIAGIVSQLAGDRPYATSFVWPIAIAAMLVLVVEVSRVAQSGATPRALVATAFAVLLVYEGATARGRSRWSTRVAELAEGIEYLRHAAPSTATRTDYAQLLAAVPAGARVAVWVAQPERLDYTRHTLVDLRTPRVARYRELVMGPHRRNLARIAKTARYLLVELDDSYIARSQGNVVYRALCADVEATPGCADDLEALALRPPLARSGNTVVVALP